MREEIRDRNRLEHILECIGNLYEFTDGVTFGQFTANKILKFAVIKNIEIIGEAAYMLTDTFKQSHTTINWAPVVKMRHVLVHGYYQIRDEIAWDVIQTDLEPLKMEVERILREEKI